MPDYMKIIVVTKINSNSFNIHFIPLLNLYILPGTEEMRRQGKRVMLTMLVTVLVYTIGVSFVDLSSGKSRGHQVVSHSYKVRLY